MGEGGKPDILCDVKHIVFRRPAFLGEEEETLVYSKTLNDEQIMQTIRSFQPAGAPPLSREDIYLHSGIAATSDIIPGRHMRLGLSTLKNIAEDMNSGVAYMLSHNHSGLPIGRTFAGSCKKRRLENGESVYVVDYSAYFVRGVSNGEMSSDDHARLVQSGIIFDNSVGIYGGRAYCDVCGKDYFGTECGHIAGSTQGMSAEQIAEQRKRGADDGCCTVTIEGARCTEISSVFDGAIEGAGIKTVFSGRPEGEEKMSLQKLVETLFGRRPVILVGGGESSELPEEKQQVLANSLTEEEESLLEKIRLEKEAAEMELQKLREERAAKERDFLYEDLQKSGYLSPAEYEQNKELLLSLDKGQAEQFAAFLKARGAAVPMQKMGGAVNAEELRSEFEMKTGQERLHAMVLARCKEKNIDYRVALTEVLKENPGLADYREE